MSGKTGSQTEYAAHAGISRQAVSKGVKKGTIPVLPDGRINFAAADKARRNNTDPSQALASAPSGQDNAPAGSDASALTYTKARAVRESYQARLVKKEYEVVIGKLLPRNEIEDAKIETGRAIKQSLDDITGWAEELESAARHGGVDEVRSMMKNKVRDLEEMISGMLKGMKNRVKESGVPDTLAVIATALAIGLTPAPNILPSVWASENLVLTDGDDAGKTWRPDLAPYLVEILNRTGPSDPCNTITVRKPSQVGFTQLATAWMGYIADVYPAPAMVVFPTVLSVADYNRDKFHPALVDSPVLRKKVFEARTRSGRASTALNKRFRGGFITLTGANSSTDLRSKTIKYVFCDEVDDWPVDLNNQGDPMDMVDARQRVYYARGEYKKLQGSTPTLKNASKIDELFEQGDQRYFQVSCPHCDEMQRLEFGGKDLPFGLKFDKEWPFNARYVCRHCGAEIENYERAGMVAKGEWIPEKPEPGRQPSYHIDILLSPFVKWNDIVAAFLASKSNAAKLKTFVNLWLGESWDGGRSVTPWKRLFTRRDIFAPRSIPPGALLFTAAVDVQKDGVYYEVVVWGRDRQSWSIDAAFIEGDPSDPANEVWNKLDEVYQRKYADAYGQHWPVDLMAVDAGYNANAVYLWTRTRPKARAIRGKDGWQLPAISTQPSKVDVDADGVKISNGALLWNIGTWPLKSELYANLKKEGIREGAVMDPPGYVHLSEKIHDEKYCKQLTSERLIDKKTNGRIEQKWEAFGQNHYHDCRIYNMAMVESLGLSYMTPADWVKLMRQRGVVDNPMQGDLLAGMHGHPQTGEETAVQDAPPATQGGGVIPRRGNWIRR